MQRGASLSRDAHREAREAFVPVTHPRLGERRVVRPPWRMQGVGVTGPAPLLGQHNELVLRDILGLDPAEIERLEAERVVY